MLQFFKNIRRSVYDPVLYTELETRSTWLTLRYYSGLVVLVALVFGVAGTIFLSPLLTRFIGTARPVIESTYPKDLVITIKSGSAASSVQSQEPYAIPMPQELRAVLGTSTARNLVVINTREKADLGRFATYNTWLLVAKDGILFPKSGGTGDTSLQFQPYTSDLVITQSSYLALIDKLASFGDTLPLVICAFLIIAFIVWGLVRLLYFLVVALLVWLLLKSRQLPGSYGYSYRIAVHAATVPILANVFLFFVTGTMRSLSLIPFVFTIVLLGVVWLNLRKPV